MNGIIVGINFKYISFCYRGGNRRRFSWRQTDEHEQDGVRPADEPHQQRQATAAANDGLGDKQQNRNQNSPAQEDGDQPLTGEASNDRLSGDEAVETPVAPHIALQEALLL